MLFGRRKPGFSEQLRKMTGAMDHSGNESPDAVASDSKVNAANPGALTRDMAAAMTEPIDGGEGYTDRRDRESTQDVQSSAAETDAAGGVTSDSALVDGHEKPELMAYLDSLPDAPDPDGVLSAGEVEEEVNAENAPEELLADYIRRRSAGALLTAKADILREVEDAEARIEAFSKNERCSDIVTYKGAKDEYFYSNAYMSDNYAMLASLVEDKDIPATIASMVRFNCKTYPAPTPLLYFTRSPYNYSIPQLNRAITLMMAREEYKDVHQFTNKVGQDYFYSDKFMKEKYARALADPEEFTD
ncbi:hypothetical protein [Oribacterium sp. WCC10]|uniref:hypothetical protein n=1 Tax=Oribacterium sp. WCC10 TaxID=1855343 RepID=UPI0008E191F8|nr:hypothetical protein [Oribacterium sp. WCC10]SFG18919.1 hypothetical protein SAMN05216356_10336 [Oribacterium sp. WCC10]